MPNFTKQAIKASFLKLLNEQPLNQISVRDIVEDCGINRNSFYYHFHDIPALIEEIVTDAADTLIRQYPNISSIEEAFDAAFHFTLNNKKAILHIYHSVNRNIYEQYLMRICEYVVTTYFNTVFGKDGVTEEDRSILILFVKCELYGVVTEWIITGMPDDAIDKLHHLLSLCHGLSHEMIQRCREHADKSPALE